jgi:hypothetical protein
MQVLQWQCQACRHQTPAVPVPFNAHGPIPPTDLYCTLCGEMSAHAAILRSPTYTVGQARAAAAADEQAERAFDSMVA